MIYHHKLTVISENNEVKYTSSGFNSWGKPLIFRSASAAGCQVSLPSSQSEE